MSRPYKNIKDKYPPKAGKYECMLKIGSMTTEIIERVVYINPVMVRYKDTCCGDWTYILAWRLTDEDLFYRVIEGAGFCHAIEHKNIQGILDEMERDLVEVGCTYRDHELMLVEAELGLEAYTKEVG